MIFRELGDYSNSEKYSLYAAAHQAMRLGKWELAEANLKLIAPFASSAWCLQYIDAAREAEQGALDKALAGFAALGRGQTHQLLVEILALLTPLLPLFIFGQDLRFVLTAHIASLIACLLIIIHVTVSMVLVR